MAWQTKSQLPDYHVRVIKSGNMMNPSDIEQIIKDDKGFLWLMAASKVQRFDGKNFRSFSFDGRCVNIRQDKEGIVWLATSENVYQYKNDFKGFEKLNRTTNDSSGYQRLLAGPGKKLYLLTSDGIKRWNQDLKKFDFFGIAPFKSSGSFLFLESKDDWIFYRLNINTLVRYNVITARQDSVKVNNANAVFPVNADTVWARLGIGGSALISFTAKTVSPIQATQFDEPNYDNRFYITGSYTRPVAGEVVVFINDKGYYVYNSGSRRFKKINLFYNGLPLMGEPPIFNSYQEDNGTVWFANEEGLIHFNPFTYGFGLLRSKTGPGYNGWNNDIRNFAEDKQGNIWFANANGFCKWDKNKGEVTGWLPKFEADNYLNYASVRSVGVSQGKIIIGQSEKGFWIFDPEAKTFKRPLFESDSLKKQFLDDFNTNMVKMRNGNFLILSRNLWLLEKETFRISKVLIAGISPRFKTAYEDAQGRIWLVGGPAGIYAVDNKFRVLFSLKIMENERWRNAIVQTGDETFWIAAKNLYEIKLQPEKQLSWRPIFPELKALHFSNLYKDSLQRIWMSSDQGLFRYIPEKRALEKFDHNDNVQQYYVSVSNSFKSRDGTVYFGSMNGINYFVPEKIPLQGDSMQIHLVNVTVNQDDSSFLLHNTLANLKHYQNSFVFDFIAPYLYNAEKLQYRYKLEGSDKDWINLGNNTSVRFTSLQPGKYSFYAAASLNGKDWFEINTPFSFTINPPFWKSWWFISLLVLSVSGGIYSYIKRREKIIREKEKQKTEIQALKAGSYRYELEIEQVTNFFGATIHMQDTVDAMLWDVSKNLIGKLGFEDSMIYLWDKDKTMLLQRAGYGIKGSMQIEPDKNKYHVKKGTGIIGAAVESKQAILVNDTTSDKRYFSADGNIRLSELCVPVIHNNEVIGAINTEHSEKNFYTSRHLQILTTIASMLADKIDMLEAQQQTREKEIELLKLNKDLATSQLTALRTQMNPHFIFNALNSVQQYILQGNVVEANKYLSKFSKLQRDILHYSNHQFISLEKEIEILNSYLQLEQLRFGESFSFDINICDEIDPAEIKIPPMMLQPFVENAIWHGLMPKPGERKLTIHFDLYTDDILQATIRDNGIGREASAKLKQNNRGSKLPHESKGMSMVQQRLQLLQLQYDKPFDAAITDITDVNGMVLGTQVTLKIFIGNKLYEYN